MTDVLSKQQRSRCMSMIRSTRNATTELRLIEIFRQQRITGWRRHARLPGKPDFVFRAQGMAIFVDGCFWHACPKHRRIPKENAAYWRTKMRKNRARDREITRLLTEKGWKVLRIWEHSLRKKALAVD